MIDYRNAATGEDIEADLAEAPTELLEAERAKASMMREAEEADYLLTVAEHGGKPYVDEPVNAHDRAVLELGEGAALRRLSHPEDKEPTTEQLMQPDFEVERGGGSSSKRRGRPPKIGASADHIQSEQAWAIGELEERPAWIGARVSPDVRRTLVDADISLGVIAQRVGRIFQLGITPTTLLCAIDSLAQTSTSATMSTSTGG